MQESKDFLNNIIEKIKEKKEIDDEFIEYIDNVFSNKSVDVLETIKRGITKYIYKPSERVIWVSIGTDSDHLIYPKLFCSCHDFYQNVIILKKRLICKHLLAQLICESLDNFNEVELEDSEFKERIRELN